MQVLRSTTLRRPVAALLAAASLATVAAAGTATAAPRRPAFGPVIDDVSYEPQRRCSPHAKPGVVAFRAMARTHFGAGDLGITRSCGRGGVSEHKEGRAWDAAYNYYKPAQRANAQRLIAWLTAPDEYGNPAANAKRLGVMYVIWNKKIWAPYAEERGWRPYRGASSHRDHIHISFTWDGAMKRSTWWDAERSFAPPVVDVPVVPEPPIGLDTDGDGVPDFVPDAPLPLPEPSETEPHPEIPFNGRSEGALTAP